MKNRMYRATLISLFLLLWMGVSSASARVNPAYGNVSVQQAAALIQENQDNSRFVIIDVRTPAEFQQGYISGAVLIDIMSSSFSDRIKGLDRTKQYLIYCRSGNRSRRAMGFMAKYGFEQIYNMSGGFNDWVSKGFKYTY